MLMRFWIACVSLGLGACLLLPLAGCETVPKLDARPVRVTNLTPSTFCRQMTVLDHLGQKQCRASYAKEDTPMTANNIEDICTRWEAACLKGKGK
jgi:hypothetical protein